MSNTLIATRPLAEADSTHIDAQRGGIPDAFVHVYTALLVVGAVIVFLQFQHQFDEIRAALLSTTWGTTLLVLSLSVLAFKVGFLVFLLVHFLRYRETPSVDDELPTCTVIVPAYNEGRLVYDTLVSVARSSYPRHKLQVLAIDDGSTDDTWAWIQRAAQRLGDLVTVHQQPRNMGKRHALHWGFTQGRGEVFVTIDSDSVVDPDTLRNLVSPFVTDPRCGAVAGNVKVLNAESAIIPKMLSVSFAYSFGVVRAAQSTMGSVLCTPGALAAYRRDAVLACLDRWVNQTFLGVPSDIGEDRAMTNLILKQGRHVLFQRNAVVYTNTPENYRTLRKMYTRWERSNVRENIVMSTFAFTKFREAECLRPRLLLLNQWIAVLWAVPALLTAVLLLAAYPRLFLSSMVVSVALLSLIPATYYAATQCWRRSLWIFSYNIFYAFTLFWITPFAIATARTRGWLTR
ncbi:MAG: glycosyltransferase family 2 protein [Gemmatimonadaceae bacterium]|nr:glycosyltransferase family 2 protein [Gemmatimonadaceae bacterium]MCW5826470.1 glycosyltransferase family 2 protein [Gemmatimonadaceae bacterium]